MDDLLELYILFRSNPDLDEKDDLFFSSVHGCGIKAVKDMKAAHPEWARRALDARRDFYSEHTLHIDMAILQAAKKGDTKAAELWYRRFDGYDPRIVQQTNNFFTFADIMKAMSKTPKANNSRLRLPQPPAESEDNGANG